METAIVTSLVSGIFALATALGSVWLKHHLEQSRSPTIDGSPPAHARQLEQGRPSFTVLRPMLVVILAFFVGAAFSKYKTTGSQETAALIGLYTFIAVSFIGLVLIHRCSNGGFWPFQLDCIALWAAFASGYSLVRGNVWSDLIVSATMFWLAFAVIGGLIVRFSRPPIGSAT